VDDGAQCGYHRILPAANQNLCVLSGQKEATLFFILIYMLRLYSAPRGKRDERGPKADRCCVSHKTRESEGVLLSQRGEPFFFYTPFYLKNFLVFKWRPRSDNRLLYKVLIRKRKRTQCWCGGVECTQHTCILLYFTIRLYYTINFFYIPRDLEYLN
jgi:hypothetical protein